MSNQADAVLKYAKKWADEKYREGPNNDTVFGKWIGLNNRSEEHTSELQSH